MHRSGAALPGKVVVIDPGHGGAEGGASGNGLREADVVLDLAARLEGRLAAVGVRVLLTRGADSCPSEAARAAFANQARADLVVSLHVDRVQYLGLAQRMRPATDHEAAELLEGAQRGRAADAVPHQAVVALEALEGGLGPRAEHPVDPAGVEAQLEQPLLQYGHVVARVRAPGQ